MKDRLFDDIIKKNIKTRTYYTEYGKVFKLDSSKVLKKAFIFDAIAPLTFGVPTILAIILYLVTFGNILVFEVEQ